MRIRGLGRQCECLIQKWRRHKHGKRLSHVEILPSSASTCTRDRKGRRPRRDDRRGPLGHLRLRRGGRRRMGRILDPAAKCVYESGVTRFDLQKKAHGAGRRLRRRRGLEDDRSHRPTARGRTTATTLEFWRACCQSATSWRYACPTTRGAGGARDLVRARWMTRARTWALQAAAIEVPDAARIRVQQATPTGQEGGNWTAAHWAWIRSSGFSRGRPTTTSSRTTSMPSDRRWRTRRGWRAGRGRGVSPDGRRGSTLCAA